MTGYCLRTDNEVVEYMCEDFSQTERYDEVEAVFLKMFTSPTGKTIERKYIDQLLAWI